MAGAVPEVLDTSGSGKQNEPGDGAEAAAGRGPLPAGGGGVQGPPEGRLAQLGSLVAGFAHEVRNPLSTIGLQLQLLQEELRLQETLGRGEDNRALRQRTLKKLDLLQAEVRRLQSILDEFLGYVRRPELQVGPVDLNRLLQEVVDFVEPEMARQSTVLRFHPRENLPPVEVDENQVRRALLNLLINAKQALDSGGEVMVETGVPRGGGTPDRGMVRVTVTDTGPGMTPEVLEKCFQPYFSTKKGGSGLGLPTTRRIIEDHGGSIQVESQVGRGTRFLVDLPPRPPAWRQGPSP